jgi:hypothetical protein
MRGEGGKGARGKVGKWERGKEGKRERGKEGKRERGKEGKREELPRAEWRSKIYNCQNGRQIIDHVCKYQKIIKVK